MHKHFLKTSVFSQFFIISAEISAELFLLDIRLFIYSKTALVF